jgi:hypothetical protein
VLLHTKNYSGVTSFFFTAEEVMREFHIDPSGKFYVFGLTDDRKYPKYRNVPPQIIVKRITDLINQTQQQKNAQVRASATRMYEYATSYGCEDDKFNYHLKFLDEVPIVLIESRSRKDKQLLELRRDIFSYLGNYMWGYGGTAPQFLTTCLLAHHFNGRAPTGDEMRAVLDGIISQLDPNTEHIVSTELIESALTSAAEQIHQKPSLLHLKDWVNSNDYKDLNLGGYEVRYIAFLNLIGYSTYLRQEKIFFLSVLSLSWRHT